ncbi:sporozoite-specific protein S10 [Plasmodium yoelii yoelii]|nr:sporozoite-specific protein S10 [Plasmodium yoelii yoelii]DAA02259.1 TPA_exp: S10 sporozoite-induced protein precursor [Plasmodium yoelii]
MNKLYACILFLVWRNYSISGELTNVENYVQDKSIILHESQENGNTSNGNLKIGKVEKDDKSNIVNQHKIEVPFTINTETEGKLASKDPINNENPNLPIDRNNEKVEIGVPVEEEKNVSQKNGAKTEKIETDEDNISKGFKDKIHEYNRSALHIMNTTKVSNKYEDKFDKILNFYYDDLLEKEKNKNERETNNSIILKEVNKETLLNFNDLKDEITQKKSEPTGETITKYVNTLLKDGEMVLKLNTNKFFNRMFKLIVREKLMYTVCYNEKISKNGRTTKNEEEISENVSTDGSNNRKMSNKQCGENCFLSRFRKEIIYKEEDIYNYYVSLEKLFKKSEIYMKTDMISKYFKFYPTKKIIYNFENVINNNIFIESVRSILFDSYKNDEKSIYTSFAVVVDSLFSLIREEAIIEDMRVYIERFFKDIGLLNQKVLTFLKTELFNESMPYQVPNLTKKNFEHILVKIYLRSVLENILNKKISHRIGNKEIHLKFSFIDNSETIDSGDLDKIVMEENLPSNASEQDVLCKFIPIKKR